MAPNGTNLVLFKIRQKIKRKLVLKSTRFVPFGVNLNKLEAKSDIHAMLDDRDVRL